MPPDFFFFQAGDCIRDSPVTGVQTCALPICEVSRSAGELLLEWWPKLKEISDEGDNDIVTNVDKAAEILIRDELARQFPTHGFYGEELKGDRLESGFVWVVDPIDGTRNYAMGIPCFSIVVALAKDGEVVTGVNYDPLRDEMFRDRKSTRLNSTHC